MFFRYKILSKSHLSSFVAVHYCIIDLNCFIFAEIHFFLFSFSQSSNMLNQARLKVLKVREDHVRSVLDDARRRLGEVTRDQGKYSEILERLILQGLYQVMCGVCYVILTEGRSFSWEIKLCTKFLPSLHVLEISKTKGMLY